MIDDISQSISSHLFDEIIEEEDTGSTVEVLPYQFEPEASEAESVNDTTGTASPIARTLDRTPEYKLMCSLLNMF